MTRRKTATVALSTAGLLALTGGAAYAAWTLVGSGSGSTAATSVGAPGTPAQGPTAASTTTIPLTWTAATAPGPGALGYVVERALGSARTTWVPACGSSEAAPISTTSCSDSGLTPGTEYVYRVTSTFQKWRATSGTSGAIRTASAPAPGTPALAAGSDSGSPNDRITNVNKPTVTGTGAVADATVAIFADAFSTPVGTGKADATGAYSVTLTTALTDGSRSLTAKQTVAGSESGASGVLAITIDTVAPVVAAPTLSSAQGGQTVTVTGSVATGAVAGTTAVSMSGDTTGSCTVTTTATSYSATCNNVARATGQAAQKTTTFTVKQSDVASNEGSGQASLTQ